MVGDGWSLADGEALHADAPRTFFIPDRAHRESIPVGRFVKLVFVLDEPRVVEGTPRTAERMWVEVVEVLPHGSYAGTLANDPGIVTELTFGDRLEFRPEHVVAILYSDEELGYDVSGWAYVDSRVRRDDQPPDYFVFDSPAPGSAPMWFGAIGPNAPDATMTLGELTDRWPQLADVFRSGAGLWQRVEGAAEWREVRPDGGGN
jgi:hypothetical protein